jgi:hypothetical protein
VDGLATWALQDQDSYRERAAGVATHGYMRLPKAIAADAAGIAKP